MQLIFNLFPAHENLYLPVAYLAQTDRDGTLTYLTQRATPATCAPYGIELTPPLSQLLAAAERLAPKAIEAHFKPPKTKIAPTLSQLLDPKNPTKSTVEAWVHRHLDAFLADVVRQRIPLALDAERKTLVKDVQLAIAADELVPHLSFKKTPEGIEYRFQLGTDTDKWPISSREVIALTNTNPAWLIADHVLFRVPGINGNMVRPFRQKDAIHIPPDKVRVYFRQFIARSAGRGHIEADGFDLQVARTLRRTRLELLEDVLVGEWIIRPTFEYDGAEFATGERRDHVTTVEYPDGSDDVLVRKVSRDHAAEAAQLAWLEKMGLAPAGRNFTAPSPGTPLPAGEGPRGGVAWLAAHQAALAAAGFGVQPLDIDGHPVALLEGQLSVRSQVENDWFDVQGEVQVGPHTFPFSQLVPHLRSGDRFFPLPDGTFFLIPEAWFARYADLALALTDGHRLPKSLFMLLEADSDHELPELPVLDPELIDYQPSTELRADLRPYQLYGVKWLIGHLQHGFGACLADDMGLGKTLQTIAALLYAKSQRGASEADAPDGQQMDLFRTYRHEIKPLQALVVLPASLVFNWQRELERFAPSLFVRAHVGPKRERDPRVLGSHDVVLTTYHTARQDLDFLEKINWHVVVLDESQQIKNRQSELSKVIRSLPATHKISLSGTPIENSLADLWSQMEFINPATLGSYAQFRKQFQQPIERQGDADARERLFARVRPFFLRRTKREVAPDLPPLVEQVFFSEMSPEQRKRYDELKSAVRNEILELFDNPQTRLLAIQALTRLRQLANHPLLAYADYAADSGKTDDVLAQWDTIRRAGHKVLFFSSFEQHLQVFRRVFEKEKIPYAWLTGDTPAAQRADVVTRFQEDATVQAFFCTLKAGGVGLNLTAADYIFILDPWWNPAAEDQAIARAHRIGQSRPVTAVRFISRHSIEEKIQVMQARKKSLGEGLFADGSEIPALTRADMAELLEG
jgi:superfamily II DNA or RNA helicase